MPNTEALKDWRQNKTRQLKKFRISTERMDYYRTIWILALNLQVHTLSIMQTQKTEVLVSFHEPKPAAIRMWHWLSAVTFSASIITVIFGSTLFRMRNNIAMVQEQVAKKGGTITADQARSVAHEYSDKLWMLHKYIGYGLAGLLLWRIIIEIFLSKEKTIKSKVIYALHYPIGADKSHFLFVQYGYMIFYALFIFMALTGLILAFEDQAWLEPLHDPANTVHEILQYGFYIFIIIHLISVIRADLTKYGGIVSRMINGKTQ